MNKSSAPHAGACHAGGANQESSASERPDGAMNDHSSRRRREKVNCAEDCSLSLRTVFFCGCFRKRKALQNSCVRTVETVKILFACREVIPSRRGKSRSHENGGFGDVGMSVFMYRTGEAYYYFSKRGSGPKKASTLLRPQRKGKGAHIILPQEKGLD